MIDCINQSWLFTHCPTIPISSGFSRFCLKIPNPDQYAIGIGKITIFKSVLINTQEHLTECTQLKLIPRKRKYTTYNIKQNRVLVCEKKQIKIGEKTINLASILERNRTLRTQEKCFRALKFQNFLGSMLPDPARDSHPRRLRDAIRILYYLKNKSRFYVLKRLDSPSLTSCGLIRDGLFTNWKFGFDSDPLLHDLQPSCSWASLLCILVLYGELIPSSFVN